jgi:hypothetical protein
MKGPQSMDEDDLRSSACEADATGILHCLRMLAEEAASLRLTRTLAALRQALDVCAAEKVVDVPADEPDEPPTPVHNPRVLH